MLCGQIIDHGSQTQETLHLDTASSAIITCFVVLIIIVASQASGKGLQSYVVECCSELMMLAAVNCSLTDANLTFCCCNLTKYA